jgi:hypothetical protein
MKNSNYCSDDFVSHYQIIVYSILYSVIHILIILT